MAVREGDLFALREALYFFRDIVRGAHIAPGADHLNTSLTTTTGELRQPGKVFRWLLEIVGTGKARWAFTPGAANIFADWASRNPVKRDLIIPVEKSEAGLDFPTTLKQAFLAAVAAQGVSMHIDTRAEEPKSASDAAAEVGPTQEPRVRRFRHGENLTGELVTEARSCL